MANRRGLGTGKGKGYYNIINKDKKVHSDSAKGRKQPQKPAYMKQLKAEEQWGNDLREIAETGSEKMTYRQRENVAYAKQVTHDGVNVYDWFIEAFGRQPADDLVYYLEWVKRFKTDPVGKMDKTRRQIFYKMKREAEEEDGITSYGIGEIYGD